MCVRAHTHTWVASDSLEQEWQAFVKHLAYVLGNKLGLLQEQLRHLSSPLRIILKGKGTKRKTRVGECGPVVEYLYREGMLCVQSPALCDEGSHHHQTRQGSQKKPIGCGLCGRAKG